MNKVLVSIITPTYNGEVFIKDTIESIISQTYCNWELIIVDDCSTDNTPDIVKGYTKKDPRIKYFRTPKPSGSPSVPRNIGIEKAEGSYIAFLDSDDIWLPDKLETELAFAQSNGYHIVYSYYEKIDEHGHRNNRVIKTRKDTRYGNLLKTNSIPCLTSLISREAVGSTRFKEISQEDFCFWLDILKKGFVAYNLCQVTALYRQAKNSRSANKFDMFKGYWNVIRKQQNISLFPAFYYMVMYTIYGVSKYLK